VVLWLFALYFATFEAFFLSPPARCGSCSRFATCGLRYTSRYIVRRVRRRSALTNGVCRSGTHPRATSPIAALTTAKPYNAAVLPAAAMARFLAVLRPRSAKLCRFWIGLRSRPMNIHQNYALRFGDEQTAPCDGGPPLTRPAISGVILFTDVAAIVAMSWLDGIAYHLVVYGHTGDFLPIPMVPVRLSSS